MTSFSGLCADLDCELTNFRDRWSAYNEKKRRGVFTVWSDRLARRGKPYKFIEADAKDSRIGARELKRHIDAVMTDGAEAFGILCEAKDTTAVPRSRKRFDSEVLLALKFALKNGVYVAYVVGEVSTAAVKAGRSATSVRRWTDALDDLPNEPIGSAAPERVSGTTSVFIRDSKVREAVLARAKGKCEYCGQQGFQMMNGTRYLEAHHIIGLAHQGPDTVDNVIALCANHHREAHFGKGAQDLEVALRRKLKALRRGASGD
jgi:5-methylcytosine-specific restriction enzyme A